MKNPRILVPTDFSDLSKTALRAASIWVRQFGGEVTLMHAFEGRTDLDGFHFFGPDETVSGDLPTVKGAIERLLDEWVQQNVAAEHTRQSLLIMGNPERSIAKASLDHDLVVIASHGRSGIPRFFLGSVTDQVIRFSPTPVLVVADESALLPLKRILVPTDLSFGSEAAFEMARDLANASGAAIDLLYVHEFEDAVAIDLTALERRVREMARPHLATATFDITVRVSGESVHQEIHQFLQQRPCNLIVMATSDKEGSGYQLLGRTPSQVVREVTTAILLVNTPEHRDQKRAALDAG